MNATLLNGGPASLSSDGRELSPVCLLVFWEEICEKRYWGTVSGSSYRQLHRQLQDLIIRGAKVADATAGTPEPEIHDWIEQARSCLILLKDKIPTEFSYFEQFRQSLEFKVKDEASASKSAYVPEGMDERVDFRFENLLQVNGILKVAAGKVVVLVNAAEGGSKSVFFDVRALKSARTAMNITQLEAASWFKVDVRTFRRWEAGECAMHRENNRHLDVFLEWATQGHKGRPPDVLKMPS